MGDNADLAAAVGDEGVQHAHTGELHPLYVNHWCFFLLLR